MKYNIFGFEVKVSDKGRFTIPDLIRERNNLIFQSRIFVQKIDFGEILISVGEPEELYISLVVDGQNRATLPKKAGFDEFMDKDVRVLECKKGFMVLLKKEKKSLFEKLSCLKKIKEAFQMGKNGIRQNVEKFRKMFP